jgi:pilus assembly protein FimV
MIYYPRKPALGKLAHLAALVMWSTSVSAAGLGPIQLHSGLGQQLRANIPLMAFNANEIEPSCIKATVESADGAYLATPQVGLISKGVAPAIVLSSKQTMMEPALILRLNLTCGTLINREYQILLDPPQYDLANGGERLPATAAGIKSELRQAPDETPAASTVVPRTSTTAVPVPHAAPLSRTAKPRKAAAPPPKAAVVQPPKTQQPQRSVLKITTAEVAAAPVMTQVPASALSPSKSPSSASAPTSLSIPASATSSTIQPDLQMYALQAQMKDQMLALQKEMAAIRQQNQLDKVKLEELRNAGVTPQVMQGLVGLLLLCLGAIGWLGWRLYSLKNNHRLE